MLRRGPPELSGHPVHAGLATRRRKPSPAWFATPTNYTLVAERDGEVVGVALLTQAGKLSLCYVLPEVMHRGVGKALLHGVEDQARAWGIGVLKLNSTASARDFYARNGYTNGRQGKILLRPRMRFLLEKPERSRPPTAPPAPASASATATQPTKQNTQ